MATPSPTPACDDPMFGVARQIHRRLARHAAGQPDPFTTAAAAVADAQVAVGVAHRRIEKARRHGWQLAARALRPELAAAARTLHHELDRLLAASDAKAAGNDGRDDAMPALPSLSLIVDELRQLREEFDDVEVRSEKRATVICARTDCIVLEGVDLGPFEIRLHVGRLDARHADPGCFDCVALDPNPASSGEETTHPHVQSNSLCAGDAALPISQALRQGRVFDAFALVRSVLQTYNDASPYVALDNWSGSPCPDCGRSVSSDDLFYCEACGRDYCDGCTGRCDVCGESTCDGCLERDRVSRRDCCPSCRHVCDACNRTVDADSFDSDSDRCPQCAPATPEDDDNTEEDDDDDDGDDGATGEAAELEPEPLTTEIPDHEQPQPLAAAEAGGRRAAAEPAAAAA